MRHVKIFFLAAVFCLVAVHAHADSSWGGGSTPTIDEVLAEGATATTRIGFEHNATVGKAFCMEVNTGIDEFCIGDNTGANSYYGMKFNTTSAHSVGHGIYLDYYSANDSWTPIWIWRQDLNGPGIHIYGGSPGIRIGKDSTVHTGQGIDINYQYSGYAISVDARSGTGNKGIQVTNAGSIVLTDAINLNCFSAAQTGACGTAYHKMQNSVDNDAFKIEADFTPAANNSSHTGAVLYLDADANVGAYTGTLMSMNVIEMTATATMSATSSLVLGTMNGLGTGLDLNVANASNAANVIDITTNGTGALIVGDHTGASGNLVTLNDGGAPVFTVDNDGDVVGKSFSSATKTGATACLAYDSDGAGTVKYMGFSNGIFYGSFSEGTCTTP